MQKSPFYTLQGLGSLRLLPAGLAGVDSRRAVCSWPWENDAVAGIAAEPQWQFKMWWGQLPFNRDNQVDTGCMHVHICAHGYLSHAHCQAHVPWQE